jgi:hypothetical protein
MTWNEQNHANSIMDVLEGTVEEWYDQVDGLLKASDFIPGNYEYSINVAYSNAGEFDEGGQTHLDIGCDRFKIISLDNSYISLEMTIPITVPALAQAANTTTTRFKKFYIGFKSAFDAIDQYRIYSNTDLIQTQNHANYESFLQYMALSDVAKENSELYATWNKIQNFNEDVPGVYVDISAIGATDSREISVPLKLRIPLNQFLMFANLKWFPGFFGRLVLEIYPSFKNLVVCPIIGSGQIESDETAAAQVPAAKVQMKQIQGFVGDDLAASTVGSNLCGFRQINTPVFAGFNDTTATHAKAATMGTFRCTTSRTNKCHIRLAETVVRMDVYNQILSRFINQPMLFPIQTIISKDFSGQMPNGGNLNLTMTNALNHCNSMFIVFKKSHDDRTCFENPMIKWQVNIDGKFFPREEYQTYSDHKNINLFLDATNFNGNGLFSVPNDIYHSLQPFLTTLTYAADGTRTPTTTFTVKDRSNFAIGIPFCEDDTFQAGIHSGGTVQVELRGSRTNIFPTMYTNAPTGLYVEDCILKLRAVKPSGEPQIAYTHATPEQLLSTAVVAN